MKHIISSIIILIGALSIGKEVTINANYAERCIPSVTINSADTTLHLINGVLYYNSNEYSGYVNSYYSNGVTDERRSYLNGKLEGITYAFFENGRLQSERLYVKGEKDGIHRGWYDDGSQRFEYRFNNGMNEGTNIDWYPDGKMWKKTFYENGEEKKVQAWRTNGKLYANYKIKDGVIYGLNNSNLCYSLKNERGNYEKKK